MLRYTNKAHLPLQVILDNFTWHNFYRIFFKNIKWYTKLRLRFVSKDDKVPYKPFIWKDRSLIYIPFGDYTSISLNWQQCKAENGRWRYYPRGNHGITANVEFHERYLTHEKLIFNWLLLNINILWIFPKLKCTLYYKEFGSVGLRVTEVLYATLPVKKDLYTNIIAINKWIIQTNFLFSV